MQAGPTINSFCCLRPTSFPTQGICIASWEKVPLGISISCLDNTMQHYSRVIYFFFIFFQHHEQVEKYSTTLETLLFTQDLDPNILDVFQQFLALRM